MWNNYNCTHKGYRYTYGRVMADLLSLQDSVTSLFIAGPLGKVLLSQDRVVGLLLHANSGGSRRVRSEEGRNEPAGGEQQALLGGRALGNGRKQLGMVAPVLAVVLCIHRCA